MAWKYIKIIYIFIFLNLFLISSHQNDPKHLKNNLKLKILDDGSITISASVRWAQYGSHFLIKFTLNQAPIWAILRAFFSNHL